MDPSLLTAAAEQPNALRDLWRSERGLMCLLILAAATALVLTGRMTTEQWTTFVQWVFATYVIGKSISGAKKPPPEAPPPG